MVPTVTLLMPTTVVPPAPTAFGFRMAGAPAGTGAAVLGRATASVPASTGSSRFAAKPAHHGHDHAVHGQADRLPVGIEHPARWDSHLNKATPPATGRLLGPDKARRPGRHLGSSSLRPTAPTHTAAPAAVLAAPARHRDQLSSAHAASPPSRRRRHGAVPSPPGGNRRSSPRWTV